MFFFAFLLLHVLFFFAPVDNENNELQINLQSENITIMADFFFASRRRLRHTVNKCVQTQHRYNEKQFYNLIIFSHSPLINFDDKPRKFLVRLFIVLTWHLTYVRQIFVVCTNVSLSLSRFPFVTIL